MRTLLGKKHLLPTILVTSLLVGVFGFQLFSSHTAHAATFNAGFIIDDIVFTNANTMTPASIQAFLQSKVPTCDTWGTQMYNSWQTRAQFAATLGKYPPFTCVKDYVENGKLAAQIIYDIAQQYRINPQVLIVLLQKEQGLITDAWPYDSQYRTATGYGCPDTAACNSVYYGFTNQLTWSAKMFRAIMDNSPTWYTPYILGNNYIQYSPDTTCGGSTVNIQNRATQALYDYTPYQPNQAALNAGWGTAPCGAYGNRNFWLYFNAWFGSTTDSRLTYKVIQSTTSPDVYLQTVAGKYYVPSYELLAEWGLYPSDIQYFSQDYLNSIPTRGTLSTSLTDGSGALFMVEGGSTHKVYDPRYTSLWNLDVPNMVESLGLSYVLQPKEAAGRFMTQRGGDGSIWLADGTQKHLVALGNLYIWGYYPGATTTVSSTLFNNYISGSPVSPVASSSTGSGTWLIDTGTKRPFKDSLTQSLFASLSPVTLSANTLDVMPSGAVVTRFISNRDSGAWYMVDQGTLHYVQYARLTTLWGKPSSESPSVLSPNFLSLMPTGTPLSFVAQDETDSSYWLLSGDSKHYIGSGDKYTALTGKTTSPDLYSHALLSSIAIGTPLGYSLTGSTSPYNYPYALDNGSRRYPESSAAKANWTKDTITVPSELISLIPEKSFISNVVKTDSGTAYFLSSSKKYIISPDCYSNWGISSTTPVLADASLNRFSDAGTIHEFVTTTSGDYLIYNDKKYSLAKYRDTYPAALPGAASVADIDLPDGGSASYLVGSTDVNDSKVWFVNQGQRIDVTPFEDSVSLGYISQGVPILRLSPATLSSLAVSSAVYSPLIQKSDSGIKLVDFGSAQGFPDANTFLAYVGSRGIMSVSPSVYDRFVVVRSATRIVYDDLGRYWLVQNGQRRYITSWTSYSQQGLPMGLPASYIYGITLQTLPVGSPI